MFIKPFSLLASLHNVGDLKFYYPSWDNTFSIIHTYSFETNKHHLICCAAHSGPLKGERKKFSSSVNGPTYEEESNHGTHKCICYISAALFAE